MDPSKIQLEIYDFLALVFPGLLGISEIWISTRGWTAFTTSLGNLSGTSFTFILILSLGLGHLIQESADAVIKSISGERTFKQGRDRFWASKDAAPVKKAVDKDSGSDISSSVDTAYDYCLTKIAKLFPKRGIFVATADLCRSFLVLTATGIAPVLYWTLRDGKSVIERLLYSLAALSVAAVMFCLSWSRMKRFYELSEVTVFRVFLASIGQKPAVDRKGTDTST